MVIRERDKIKAHQPSKYPVTCTYALLFLGVTASGIWNGKQQAVYVGRWAVDGAPCKAGTCRCMASVPDDSMDDWGIHVGRKANSKALDVLLYEDRQLGEHPETGSRMGNGFREKIWSRNRPSHKGASGNSRSLLKQRNQNFYITTNGRGGNCVETSCSPNRPNHIPQTPCTNSCTA